VQSGHYGTAAGFIAQRVERILQPVVTAPMSPQLSATGCSVLPKRHQKGAPISTSLRMGLKNLPDARHPFTVPLFCLK
jgi:hypothetical protein